MNTVQTLMVQGTTSDAGKSTLVTALCRYYYKKGFNVAPFKPQNMALNSAVTINGGEIGRAQAVQATACGLEPHTDMNPVLLKPNSDKTAQIIVHGKATENLSAQKYHHFKKQAMHAVLQSHNQLVQQYQKIIVEGAGSPAEINLREGDIANMGFAEAVDCPVILIADIDKGGVFAHLIGTLELLSKSEQNRIIGFVINRFRGDLSILQPGIDWLEKKTTKPVFAVLPYLQDFYLEAEDGLSIEKYEPTDNARFTVIVPLLPRMSNHTDFDTLRLHPELSVQFIKDPQAYVAADLIILPGSKSVITDLNWLHEVGWTEAINKHLRYGGRLMGICGGFQMLGNAIHDPQGIEGKQGSCSGLGLLDMETTLQDNKCLQKVEGVLLLGDSFVNGYEIHAGVTTGNALNNPLMMIGDLPEGAISEDNLVLGTYLHGVFDSVQASKALLKWAGYTTTSSFDINVMREKGINLITDTLEEHFNFTALEQALDAFADNEKFARGQ